jgi:hypothetical protein
MAANASSYTSMDNGATAVSSASKASQLRGSGMAARSVVTLVVSVFAAPIVGLHTQRKPSRRVMFPDASAGLCAGAGVRGKARIFRAELGIAVW